MFKLKLNPYLSKSLLLSFLIPCLLIFFPLFAEDQQIQVQQKDNETIFFTFVSQKNTNIILSQITVDENNTPEFCQTFDYDDQYQLINTTVFGNLSGTCFTPLIIDKDGRALFNGIEYYSIRWNYDPNSTGKLLSIIEDNGSTLNYYYSNVTGLIESEISSLNGVIYKRRFFSHNNEGKIEKLIVDDGTTLFQENLEGVKTRYITTFTYHKDPISSNVLEEIEEARVSLKTGKLHTIKKILNVYDGEGKLIQQHSKNGNQKISKEKLILSKTLSFSEFFEDQWDSIIHSVFDRGTLQWIGYYQGTPSSGIFNAGKEAHDKVRITAINGMLNISTDMEMILSALSKTHGDISIHYVFRPTEGWTRDNLYCACIKLGYVSDAAKRLADLWKKLIAEMDAVNSNGTQGKIIHYAHSLGASDTYAARYLLTEQEKKRIHVITIGSPTIIPDSSGFLKVENYVSKRDPVPMVDPVGYIQGLFNKAGNVYFVGNYTGLPEHTFYAKSYQDTIKNLGERFKNEHLTQSSP